MQTIAPEPAAGHPPPVPSDMFRRLVALADAFQHEHGLSDGQMADRAGMMREQYVRARKKGRTGEGDVETMTAEKFARAIGYEIVLRPVITTPDEHPRDTCGPCHAGRHERCYAPCLCADRGHAPKGGAS